MESVRPRTCSSAGSRSALRCPAQRSQRIPRLWYAKTYCVRPIRSTPGRPPPTLPSTPHEKYAQVHADLGNDHLRGRARKPRDCGDSCPVQEALLRSRVLGLMHLAKRPNKRMLSLRFEAVRTGWLRRRRSPGSPASAAGS